MSVSFPPGFVWGAATAAYQVEGAVDEDGRGRSIWDTFCERPGAIAGGDTGVVACDHYHRYPEDIDLMADLGLGAYRFSIAWPRIQPSGSGPANQKGLDHYRRVVDKLLDRGIVPWVTLYHWDLPQELQDKGGWPARDTAYRFADYAETVHAALGDVVSHWITLNEPKVSSHAGYGTGIHAPGIRDLGLRNRAAHHLLLAHGLGLRALRSSSAQVGITLDVMPVDPLTSSVADIAAARQVDLDDHLMFLDPILGGRSTLTSLGDDDLALISAPIDFLGVNYYRRLLVRAGSAGEPEQVLPHGVPVTGNNWPIQPDGLRDELIALRDTYPSLPPLYITENGAALPDPSRIDYLRRHLHAVHAAIAAGVDVRGYFVWTLMDNFEWADGYATKFGIVSVDRDDDLRRTPRASARWYERVARENTVP